ncbi:MAG: metallophosphoesterase [Lachnospiraceae bacterium]|nr:metallophosphoesterase [Lachnospiraceae bacterium]
MVYFIADTHFGEENIRLYENRPFVDITEMDNVLQKRWNSHVNQQDTIYVLGDFGANGQEKEILAQLNGRKFLVKGNHDIQTNQYYRDCGFIEVYDYPIIFKDFWILSHEPLYVNTNMPYANIFGHVHNSPIFKTYSNQHYCVSVERTQYAPISFDEIIMTIQKSNNS